ncbi:iron-sulfur cluster carrier protein ApbC [Aquabacterium soli]|jgi:ATP-binding protein involved in chromosome partitioning|uniref:Iron-sulfur cluster carrier protein n=1 Tax=Aquabacterium soli TaxID=2493092 RepID=A0A426V7I4_9BURK|nr:iron-sulfur cluster carrier protein ApbC [Aquabacterium soli]RRS02678.1 iron-sulfur cluster carrier protein ApbC [Aquabacterium soli]
MSFTPRTATETALVDALKTVTDPLTGRDWVSTRQLQNLVVDGSTAVLDIVLGYPARSQWPAYTALINQALKGVAGIDDVAVNWQLKVITHAVPRGMTALPGVKNLVAVASGKGGVGKSTTAVNLALALAAEGARVGMLDADIYGPSQPLMLGLSGKPDSPDGKTITPPVNHGIQMMSIGLLVADQAPTIWRGPMATQALDQLLRLSNWGEPDQPLDYLIVDMPPGTGDIHLTLSQRAPLTAAVVVTTPQDIALLDARKGLRMFEKVSVPVLGVVENMAVYHCPQCGHEAHIFGEHGGQRLADEGGVTLLGSLPLDLKIREQADSGRPTLVSDPDSRAAELYREIARRAAALVSLLPKDYSSKLPGVQVIQPAAAPTPPKG